MRLHNSVGQDIEPVRKVWVRRWRCPEPEEHRRLARANIL